jgi:hypothetical protein
MNSADRKKGNNEIVRKAVKSLLKLAGLCVLNGKGRIEQQSLLLSRQLTFFDAV